MELPDKYLHKVVLLTTGFSLPGALLVYARARLFPDRIELSGWGGRGLFRETICLREVRRIAWPAAGADGPTTLHLEDGRALAVCLHQPHRWRLRLEEHLRWSPWGAAPPAASELGLKELVAYHTAA